MKTALVFAAHGDDETSLGGTIKKLVLQKWKVHVIIGTLEIGNTKRNEGETKKANEILGSSYEILDFRSWSSNARRLANIFDEKIKKYKPELIFTHWVGDTHPEHKMVTMAVLVSCRRTKNTILLYREPNTGGPPFNVFDPRFLIDISSTYKYKLEAIKAYKSQYSRYKFWKQTTEGFAKFYGSSIQTKYAEAFEIVRFIGDNL